MKKIVMLIAGISVILGAEAFAWDNEKTHPKLTEEAAKASKLDDYLKKFLDIPNKVPTIKETELQHGNVSKTILAWLTYGADQEDRPTCRAMNHFHNPLKNWYESGLTDIDAKTQKYLCRVTTPYYAAIIKSNISWATGFKSPDEPHEYIHDNTWNWYYARAYYLFLNRKSIQSDVS